MSITEPPIDKLLSECDDDRFLLCAVLSERAKDINNMILGQRDRAMDISTAKEIMADHNVDPLKIAAKEIANGDIGFVDYPKK